MKRKFPVPLIVDCGGLTKMHIKILAGHLNEHFFNVKILGNEISASEPTDEKHYGMGWKLCDRWGVKVSY